MPLSTDATEQDKIGSRLKNYQMANETLVEIYKGEVGYLTSMYNCISEDEESGWRKVNDFLMSDAAPFVIKFTPLGKPGSFAYKTALKSFETGMTLYKSKQAESLTQFAVGAFGEHLFKGLDQLSQNNINVYDDITQLTSIPDVSASLQILDERKDGEDGIVYDTIYRKYIRVRLTNTGTTAASFYPVMSYPMFVSLLFSIPTPYAGARIQDMIVQEFHDQTGALTSFIRLAPGESQIIEFDLFRKGYGDLPDFSAMPDKAGVTLAFKALALPDVSGDKNGMGFAGYKPYILTKNFVFNPITTRSNPYRLRTVVRSSAKRDNGSSEMNMPLSISAFRTSDSSDVTVKYIIENPFEEPVQFILEQPLPQGMSVVSKDSELTATGIRYVNLLQGGKKSVFMFSASYAGNTADFTMPAATLKFRHPTTGEQITFEVTLKPRTAAELTPLTVLPNVSSEGWLGKSLTASLKISSDYSQNKPVSIRVSITDSQSKVQSWDFSQTLTPGNNTVPLNITVPNTLTEGSASLKITVTPENGATLTVTDVSMMLIKDSDNDGMPDTWETANGLNPYVNDASGDLDGDGLNNLKEYQIGTKANVADTDGDGLSDSQEVNIYGTDPLLADTDGGGANDGEEVQYNRDPLNKTDDWFSIRLYAPDTVGMNERFLVVWENTNPHYYVDIQYTVAVGTPDEMDDILSWTYVGYQKSYALDSSIFPAEGEYVFRLRIIADGYENPSPIYFKKMRYQRSNGDDLASAIECLRVLVGIPSPTGTYQKADVNGDGKIGLEEVIHILQKVAGLR